MNNKGGSGPDNHQDTSSYLGVIILFGCLLIIGSIALLLTSFMSFTSETHIVPNFEPNVSDKPLSSESNPGDILIAFMPYVLLASIPIIIIFSAYVLYSIPKNEEREAEKNERIVFEDIDLGPELYKAINIGYFDYEKRVNLITEMLPFDEKTSRSLILAMLKDAIKKTIRKIYNSYEPGLDSESISNLPIGQIVQYLTDYDITQEEGYQILRFTGNNTNGKIDVKKEDILIQNGFKILDQLNEIYNKKTIKKHSVVQQRHQINVQQIIRLKNMRR
jgi:hypothetical protein